MKGLDEYEKWRLEMLKQKVRCIANKGQYCYPAMKDPICQSCYEAGRQGGKLTLRVRYEGRDMTGDAGYTEYTGGHTGHENWFSTWPSVLVLPQRLTNPLFGREELNQRLQEMAASSPPIEQVWEITKRLPSLAKLLSEERDNDTQG